MHRKESQTVQVKGPTTRAVVTGMKNGLIPEFIHRSSVNLLQVGGSKDRVRENSGL